MDTSTDRSAPRAVRARGIERRSQIVDAAAMCVLEQGIASLSHRQVAAAADVPLGSTTYYFASLGELREAAVERMFLGDRERRRSILDDGLPADVGAVELSWRLIDVVISIKRLDQPFHVAFLYERIGEAVRSPEMAEVLRTASTEVLADIAKLTAGTPWAGAAPDSLLALVDGRAIGWLGLGETRPELLAEGIATDLERHRGEPTI